MWSEVEPENLRLRADGSALRGFALGTALVTGAGCAVSIAGTGVRAARGEPEESPTP